MSESGQNATSRNARVTSGLPAIPDIRRTPGTAANARTAYTAQLTTQVSRGNVLAGRVSVPRYPTTKQEPSGEYRRLLER
jgi:hypothetical protein